MLSSVVLTHFFTDAVIGRENACVSVKQTVPMCGGQTHRNNGIVGVAANGIMQTVYKSLHRRRPAWPQKK